MDEVLVDTLSRQLAWLSANRGVTLRKENIGGAQLWQLLSAEDFGALHNAMHQPDFFADLPVMLGAQHAMAILGERHELFVATAAMEFPASFNAKFQWLFGHFPEFSPSRIVFCGDKSVVRADYLLDDNPRNFEGFAGRGVLFAAPHNSQTRGYPVVRNWQEVLDFFTAETSIVEDTSMKNASII